MIIYQVLPRLWGRGRFSDWDVPAFSYLKTLGITHVWYTGVIRHSTGKPWVKGDPGSPYSIEDYRDVNPYLADNPDDRLDEFKSLIKRSHDAGLSVIIDFIPNHVAPDCKDVPVLDRCDYDWTDTRKSTTPAAKLGIPCWESWISGPASGWTDSAATWWRWCRSTL